MSKHIKEMPELPEGVKVGLRPDNFELYLKGRGTADKWMPYVEALMVQKSTETLQIDLSHSDNVKKAKWAITLGIRQMAKKMGFNKRIRTALIGNILHIVC